MITVSLAAHARQGIIMTLRIINTLEFVHVQVGNSQLESNKKISSGVSKETQDLLCVIQMILTHEPKPQWVGLTCCYLCPQQLFGRPEQLLTAGHWTGHRFSMGMNLKIDFLYLQSDCTSLCSKDNRHSAATIKLAASRDALLCS